VKIALQRPLGVSLKFWRSRSCLDNLDERADSLLDAVGLLDAADRDAGELSYGRRRALELATTLGLDPELLLLDEPMAGLGREDIGTVSELIRKLGGTRTVLMVEHNLSVVAALSDVITVMARGRKIAEGSYEEVSRDPEVRTAYIGGGHA
jgi:branched-chain amino acid transport system ATP-binding protein